MGCRADVSIMFSAAHSMHIQASLKGLPCYAQLRIAGTVARARDILPWMDPGLLPLQWHIPVPLPQQATLAPGACMPARNASEHIVH